MERVLRARVNETMHQRALELARQKGFTYGGKPNVSKVLRLALTIGLKSLENGGRNVREP